MSTISMNDLLSNNDDVNESRESKSESNTESKSTHSILELDCSLINVHDMTTRICEINSREYTHSLRKRYKKTPIKNNVFSIVRVDERDSQNKLIAKNVCISIKNNDQITNFDFDNDLNVNVQLINTQRPNHLNSKQFDYLFSADNYPCKCALIAIALRLLKPYHKLNNVMITTKRSLSPDSLVINYKMTPLEILFRTCNLIFNDDVTAYIATHLLCNALFELNESIDLLNTPIKLDVLKSLESTVI